MASDIPAICYVGPCFDYSGYGEANRNFIAALAAAGVPMTVKAPTYVNETSDFGKLGAVCDALIDKPLEYQIKVLHVTPDQYHRYYEPGKYHIGHLFWETDRLPQVFVDAVNKHLDEVWTGSVSNKEAFERSGVKVPIFISPEAIEVRRTTVKPYKLPGESKKLYTFYSIFEWTERKNPDALIRAYLEEFTASDNVVLIIKTYLDNFNVDKVNYVMGELKRLRAQYGQSGARLFLYKFLMDKYQIERLHETGDCYVSAHRGEGWGIPLVEAMVAGNPVISTGYSGVHDHLPADAAKLIPFKMVPVDGMQRNTEWYQKDQNWAEIDADDLRKAMRKASRDPAAAAAMGKRGQKFAVEHFSHAAVGKILADRLKELGSKIKS